MSVEGELTADVVDGEYPGVEPVAIIGMSCRVPGAADTDEFWRNLADGVESVRFFSRAEQQRLGVDQELLEDPDFVPAAPVLDGVGHLDAGFFGLTDREAEVTDPQHRLFLELAHTALEDAGYDPRGYPGEIGLYGGVGNDDYLWRHVRRNPAVFEASGARFVHNGNRPDYVTSAVSYRLGLRGPAVSVYTACSTSLVALHMAAEALRGGECDLALAGGVCIELPHGAGYLHQEGGVESPDGHCRPFDADARGTIWGSGGGIVVLKPLAAALADGDHIRAVVLGNAVNNDGSARAGFTAPGVRGQAEVISQALGAAGVDARSISYVEAHGTGTAVGDPIELTALTRVYGADSADRGWCGIGSVKSNIGHLSQGAGVVGVIKTVLAMRHRLLPPSINFERPNPAIDFATGPFYVNATLATWERTDGPRRAAVSAFGIGGTNAHVILEEPPQQGRPSGDPRPAHLLRWSARTAPALDAMLSGHATYLNAHPELDVADVARTLALGRGQYAHRAAVVGRDTAGVAAALGNRKRRLTGTAEQPPQVAMLFSGQGAQHAGMAAELYSTEPAFARAVDSCAQILTGQLPPEGPQDIRRLCFADGPDRERAEGLLRDTAYTQPALFVVEYALAQLWLSWGLDPAAMIGHSIGEYVAATLAGVFALPDALRLVAARGRLMATVAPGAMLAVTLDEQRLMPLLPAGLSVAAVNGPGACVVSGPAEEISRLRATLSAQEINCKPLRTSHAFHSAMMDPVVERFRELVDAVPRRAPDRPFLSNLTGDWVSAEQVTDADYWARQLREPVRFGTAVGRILADGNWLLVECGPGRQLAGLARMQVARDAALPLPSLPGPSERKGDLEVLSAAVAALWVAGVPLHPDACTGPGNRVPLPSYPYQRRYHWVDPEIADEAPVRSRPDERRALEHWFSVPIWRQRAGVGLPAAALPFARCLLYGTADAPGAALAGALRAAGVTVLEVLAGDGFRRETDGSYRIDPSSRSEHDALLAEVRAAGGVPERVLYAWPLSATPVDDDPRSCWPAQQQGHLGLLCAVQALAGAGWSDSGTGAQLDVLSIGTQDVTGADLTRPEHAALLGLVRVLPVEFPDVRARLVDLPDSIDLDTAALLAELGRQTGEPVVALRAGRRWVPDHEPVSLPEPPTGEAGGPVAGGVYLITGGTGGLGLALAEQWAALGARLVLLGRSGLPPRTDWAGYRSAYGTLAGPGRAIDVLTRVEAAGGEVVSIVGDVTDPDDLARVRAQILDRFGRLDGIVHAAGIPASGLIEATDVSATRRVLAPKLAGTLALRAVFGDLDLSWVVLFSSVSAITGGTGQADYCAANNLLDAYARSTHGWRCRVLSVGWGGWQDTGMNATAAQTDGVPWEATRPVRHPLLTHRYTGADGRCCYTGLLGPETHWVLDDHRIDATPTMPGTALLDAARFAANDALPAAPGTVVSLRDVVFVAPMTVTPEGAALLRVSLLPTAEGHEVEVSSLSAGARRVHVRGVVERVAVLEPRLVELAEIRSRCKREEGVSTSSWMRRRLPATVTELSWAGRWDCLREVYVGAGEELALLEVPAAERDVAAGFGVHPVLLDLAVGFGIGYGAGRALPFGYGRLTAGDGVGERVWSHLRYRDATGGKVIVADITLTDDTGRVVASVEEFTLRRFGPQENPLALADTADPAAVSQDPDRSAEGYAIRPAEGVEALRRLLVAGLSGQVNVTTRPIERIGELIRARDARLRAGAAPVPAGPDRPGAVPESGSAVTGGTSEILAGIWGEVLGVGQVDADDDFFDLGGSSLVAVQLIARIRRAVGVRLPMRALFETPTVSQMAAQIDLLRSEQPASPTAATATAPVIPRLSRPGAVASAAARARQEGSTDHE